MLSLTTLERSWARGAMASGKAKWWVRAGIGAVVAVTIAVLFLAADMVLTDFSPRSVENWIRSLGMWGLAGVIVLMILHSVVPFPAEFVAIACGMLYGPVVGVAVIWVGAMLGAFLAFGLARWLGRPFVRAVTPERQWRKFDAWAARTGVGWVFFGRFVPVISFNLINYAAGVTRISWWAFALATGIGILPMTVLMVVMGDSAMGWPWQIWVATIAGACILYLLYRLFAPRRWRFGDVE